MSATARPPSSTKRFRLIHHYALLSLLGVGLVAAGLLMSYRTLVLGHFVEQVGDTNAQLTLAFGHNVWPRYRDLARHADGRTIDDLLRDPALQRLRTDIAERIYALNIAKVKVYAPGGRVVFSTNPAEIGHDDGSNPRFREAMQGNASSAITFKESFGTHGGARSDRDVVESYVPVRSTADGPVEGVFEIYADVTEVVAAQRRASLRLGAAVLAALGLLYAYLYLVVRKADRTISRQERRRAADEALIRRKAYSDALTGLPNRAAFNERIAATVADRRSNPSALMFLDLDRFKAVNDTLGHAAGDQLLMHVASRIGGCLRQGDSLFRMGGDEFTLILPRIGQDGAGTVANRVLQALAAPMKIGGRELGIGVSIGIAMIPADGDTVEEILRSADVAMYEAKAQGRGTYAFHTQALRDRAMQEHGLESELRRALRQGEFVLHFQPRVDTADRCPVAVEALLRWNHPTRGLVAPAQFIESLESSGLIVPVGDWVAQAVCEQVRRWRGAGVPPLRVSFNVSATQLQGGTLDRTVAAALHETGVPADTLEIELTEGAAVRDIPKVRDAMNALRVLGVRTAIDDFGTGFTTLHHLRHLPLDLLKVDREFVAGLEQRECDRVLVAAIARIGVELGLDVVAEGVETEAQARMLAAIGCHELQGHLFAPAMPGDEIPRWIASSPRRPARPARA